MTTSTENYATYNGRPFWAGVVDMTDGQIEAVYTYERCESCDFHHSFIVSPEYHDRLEDGEFGYFWLEPDHSVSGAFGFGGGQEDIPSAILERIASQIVWQHPNHGG